MSFVSDHHSLSLADISDCLLLANFSDAIVSEDESEQVFLLVAIVGELRQVGLHALGQSELSLYCVDHDSGVNDLRGIGIELLIQLFTIEFVDVLDDIWEVQTDKVDSRIVHLNVFKVT